MIPEIDKIIEYESESYKVDFKKEEYPLGKNAKKNELLKDIIAFANQHSDDDKYIIIGIKEIDGLNKQIFDVGYPTDDANYRQFVQDNIEPKINFEYKTCKYKDWTICYFRIFQNIDRPYLFKKDVVNPVTGKLDFKYGDGFIRIGTSSKKIGRKELDDNAKNLKKYFDRRSDLEILPIIGCPTDEEISNLDIQYLDIAVVNKSKKSIDFFDIEMQLTKAKEFTVLSETDFKRELKEQVRTDSLFGNLSIDTPNINFLHVSISENDSELKIVRNAMKNRTAITLPQNSEIKDIFEQSLILLQDSQQIIKAVVTIRSDDFTDGPLIQEIVFQTKN
ncbi:MAG TPA: ATP-binding protein [Phnomibacter sp.]|nr:ATP-binding protein [Phnomibacter sp.]